MTDDEANPVPLVSIEQRKDCFLCVYFKRPIRTKPVNMVVMRLFKEAKGLAICRDCWRNGASLLKRRQKK